jgi:hypothetical protein
MTDGGGASRPLAQPIRTTISQATPSVPAAAAQRRPRQARPATSGCRPPARRVPSAATVMLTRDMVACKCNAANYLFPRAGRGRSQRLSLNNHEAVVDQIVERSASRRHWRDHAGLLQREAGLQDGSRCCGPMRLKVSSVRSLS